MDSFITGFNAGSALFYAGSPHYFLLAMLFPLLFTHADRLWGADGTKLLSKLLLVVSSFIAWVAVGTVGFYGVIGWWFYRSMGFHTADGLGTNAPETPAERKATLLRHLTILPIMTAVYLLSLVKITINVNGEPTTFHTTGSSVGWLLSGLAYLVGMGVMSVYAKQAADLANGYGNLAAKAAAGDVATVELLSHSGGNYYGHVERRRGLYFGIAFGLWALMVETVHIIVAT